MINDKVNALYIHIPFCDSLCDYCDFPKLQYFNIFADKYLDSLKKEFDSYNIKDIKTIYIGGGTPTSLSDSELTRLLEMVSPLTKDIHEFTVECNPESLTISKLKLMKKYGVNRLSIGVESTNDKILSSINRKHTFEDVKKCIKNARDIGFSNINVDLILGLPNVTYNLFKKDIDNIIKLDVEHISCYSLTVHENTMFSLKKVNEPDENYSRKLYDYAHEQLLSNGYIHYEISNFAKPGKESEHNKYYWKNEQYYGLGLGASGYLNDVRYTNTKSINDYIDNKYISYKETLTIKDIEQYYIMLNLRTIDGISLEQFQNLFGYDIYLSNKDYIDKSIQNKFLNFDGKIISPTYEGMVILDQIILSLFK